MTGSGYFTFKPWGCADRLHYDVKYIICPVRISLSMKHQAALDPGSAWIKKKVGSLH